MLNIPNPKTSLEIPETILVAARRAKVKRVILSDWYLYGNAWAHVNALSIKGEQASMAFTIAEESVMTYLYEPVILMIENGCFLEYLVQGCEDKSLTAGHEDDLLLDFIDLKNNKLVLPCVSKDPLVPARVSMTSITDIGRYVAATLNIRHRAISGHKSLAGGTFTFQEIADTMATLGKPLDVTYVDARECRELAARYRGEQLTKAVNGENDTSLTKKIMVAQMFSCFCDEKKSGGMPDTYQTLDEKLSHITPVNVKSLLGMTWGGRDIN